MPNGRFAGYVEAKPQLKGNIIMAQVSMRDMLQAGVHFGHQTRYWNPKMKPFILKMFTALVIMTIIIQIIMQIVPQVGRIGGLIELVVVAIIGIAVLLILVIYMNILGYKELKHLPFGEKLYHIKKGRH